MFSSSLSTNLNPQNDSLTFCQQFTMFCYFLNFKFNLLYKIYHSICLNLSLLNYLYDLFLKIFQIAYFQNFCHHLVGQNNRGGLQNLDLLLKVLLGYCLLDNEHQISSCVQLSNATSLGTLRSRLQKVFYLFHQKSQSNLDYSIFHQESFLYVFQVLQSFIPQNFNYLTFSCPSLVKAQLNGFAIHCQPNYSPYYFLQITKFYWHFIIISYTHNFNQSTNHY